MLGRGIVLYWRSLRICLRVGSNKYCLADFTAERQMCTVVNHNTTSNLMTLLVKRKTRSPLQRDSLERAAAVGPADCLHRMPSNSLAHCRPPSTTIALEPSDSIPDQMPSPPRQPSPQLQGDCLVRFPHRPVGVSQAWVRSGWVTPHVSNGMGGPPRVLSVIPLPPHHHLTVHPHQDVP